MTVTGTAVVGYTLKLYDGATLLTSVVVGAAGTWSLTVSLAAGSHSLSATQTTSSFTSAASAAAPVTVYALPSAPSSITTTAGTVTTGATVSGHSAASGLVQVYEGSTLVGTATANASGNWTATLSLLSLGTHTLTAKVQDPVSGFWSAASSSFTVTVKPDAPSIASISTPGPTTTSTTVTVSGTGTSGSTVKVYEGATLRGTVVVGAGGSWSVSVTLTLGGHALVATQTTGSLTSDTSAPASVTVYAPPSAPSSITSDDGAVSAGATVYGHSVAGGNVEVYEGAARVGTATADAGGNWTSALAILALGRHTLTARVQDPASGFWSSSSPSFTVTVDPNAPGITSVSTPAATTTSTSVTVSGTGVAGYTVKVYEGSTFRGSVVVGAGGSWSVSISLTVGNHSLVATQTSTLLGGSTFTSDTSAATTVTVYAPTSAPFSISTNGATPSTNATASGRSVGLGNVEVYEGATLIATATANGSGNWTATLPLALRRTAHADRAGAGSELRLLERLELELHRHDRP